MKVFVTRYGNYIPPTIAGIFATHEAALASLTLDQKANRWTVEEWIVQGATA